ncbi:hypothetical protein [Mucilaginibacter sp. CSA2-8R]|uniref:hypothetical protein n=1 Tax=Mucilaginibacter sp. CSA2-8R TaxID=3141542 RepID=UPI00315C7C9C
MKSSFYTFLLLLSSLCCIAQTNFKPGYIISNTGDTLKGYIDQREWAQNPTSVGFKTHQNDRAIHLYVIDSISSFTLTGMETFERHTVALSQDASNFNYLKAGIDSSSVKKTVLLRVISQGRYLTFYSYEDKIKRRYLLRNGSETPFELSHHVYLNPQHTDQVINSTGFRKQLTKYAVYYRPNDQRLINKIQAAEYNESALIRIVDAINGNTTNPGKTSFGINAFVGGGIGRTMLRYAGQSPLAVDNVMHKDKILPFVSVGADLLPNTNVGRIIFRGELMLSGSNHEVKAFSPEFSQGNYVRLLTMYTASIVPQVLFNFYNTSDLKIYAGAGLSYNISAYTKNEYGRYYSNPDRYVDDNMLKGVETVWYNFTGKLGVIINKRYEVYATYSLPAKNTNYSQFGGKLSSIQIGFHYLLIKKR